MVKSLTAKADDLSYMLMLRAQIVEGVNQLPLVAL